MVDFESKLAPVLGRMAGSSVEEVKVTASGKVKSEKRLDITFEKIALRPKTLVGRDVSETLPPLTVPLRSPVGFIETTYVDKDIRIARAPRSPHSEKASATFVLVRVKQ